MAMPATPEAKRMAWEMLEKHLRDEKTEELRLYSLWVSELEPEIMYTYFPVPMLVAGITVKGWTDPVVATPGRSVKELSPFRRWVS